jgi:hypothetical protein
MKKIPLLALLFIVIAQTTNATKMHNPKIGFYFNIDKIDIKIKNDSGNEVTVYNSGSGGTYRLQKNVITTIKMEVGDKLYYYESGKKGKLLLTATADMVGKIQLYTKL